MACVTPFKVLVKDSQGRRRDVTTNCGYCINCLTVKQSSIEFLSKKELLSCYTSGRSASFVTLTYDNAHLPINENGFQTLRKKDLQNWIKNMRRQMDYYNEKVPFKYIYCGEYGDGSHSSSKSGVSTHRPHYHVVFFGLSPTQVSKYTRKLWKNGLCDIGSLRQGGIRYITKYLMKSHPPKDVKAMRELCGVENPFFYHSIGLGKQWILNNLDTLAENGCTYNINGKINLLPKYVVQYVALQKNISPKLIYRNYFMKSDEFRLAHIEKKTFPQFQMDKSLNHYASQKVYFRQNGIPFDDVLSKYYKAFSVKNFHDRTPTLSPQVLASHALDMQLYGDVVPF